MSREDKKNLWMAGALILLIPVSAILKSWAIMILWSWFAVTAFQLPSLTMPQVYGLMLVWQLAFPSHYETPRVGMADIDRDKAFQEAVGRSIIAPLVFLVIGYFVRMFLP